MRCAHALQKVLDVLLDGVLVGARDPGELEAHPFEVGADAARYASAVTVLGLAIWAWLEVTAGVNLFRRALGGVALVYLTVQLGGRLTS